MVRMRLMLMERPTQVSMNDYAYQQPVDPRRRPEYFDAQLIQEDNRAMANLPTKGYQVQWNPNKLQPHYWMESGIQPFNAIRMNESSTDEE